MLLHSGNYVYKWIDGRNLLKKLSVVFFFFLTWLCACEERVFLGSVTCEKMFHETFGDWGQQVPFMWVEKACQATDSWSGTRSRMWSVLAGPSRDVEPGRGALEAGLTDGFSPAPSLAVCMWKCPNSSGRLSNEPRGKRLHKSWNAKPVESESKAWAISTISCCLPV